MPRAWTGWVWTTIKFVVFLSRPELLINLVATSRITNLLGNADIQGGNRTWGHWVWSASSTSARCGPQPKHYLSNRFCVAQEKVINFFVAVFCEEVDQVNHLQKKLHDFTQGKFRDIVHKIDCCPGPHVVNHFGLVNAVLIDEVA